MKSRRVTLIGLGAMGQPMARRLQASGYELTVYDKNSSKVDALKDLSDIGSGTSPAEAANASDVIVVMVATPEQFKQVMFEDDAPIVDGLTRGDTVLVTSTVGAGAIRTSKPALDKLGVGLVDAPVSGGASRALQGHLLMMLGGAEEHIQRARDVIDSLSSDSVLCGSSPGSAQEFKLVNQVLCGVHLVAAAEALGFAEKIGVDIAEALRVLPKGAASSFMLVDRGQRMLDGADEVKSAMSIMAKDMQLVHDRASEVSARIPLTTLALELFKEGIARELQHLDDSQVIRLFRGD